jgi:hypothetical protein
VTHFAADALPCADDHKSLPIKTKKGVVVEHFERLESLAVFHVLVRLNWVSSIND